MTDAVVVLPVKGFTVAKSRLAPHLDPGERAALARRLAGIALAAARPLPVLVATDDDDVRDWARSAGASVVDTSGLDLNGSVRVAAEEAGLGGARRVIVAHADLPAARSLAPLLDFSGIVLVPDRRGDGTNVLCVDVDPPFPFSYGRGSFERHLAAARRTGRPVRIARRPDLQWDVDTSADLADIAGGTIGG